MTKNPTKKERSYLSGFTERSQKISAEVKKAALQEKQKMMEHFRKTNPAYAAMLKARESRQRH